MISKDWFVNVVQSCDEPEALNWVLDKVLEKEQNILVWEVQSAVEPACIVIRTTSAGWNHGRVIQTFSGCPEAPLHFRPL